MNENEIKEMLENVKKGITTVKEAQERLARMPFKDLSFARADTHRVIRQGFSEAVYCPGKTKEQIVNILKELKQFSPVVLATRIEPDKAQEVIRMLPDAYYDEEARIIRLGKFPEPVTSRYALIITAGTSDIPVAKEAMITVKSCGVSVKTLYDCGVAGIHRLFNQIELIQKASAIVVIAGMEGALASVVGGISSCPVVAVPTSTGYGANFDGLAPLLSMLNSCTSCVSVVNIDNGYSAGIISSMIVKQSK
jgi:hypothetical protein